MLFVFTTLLLGKSKSSALVVTNVEVSMKNSSSRNTISVMDAMLNSVVILFLLFIAMISH